jgi:hypothetical protein
MSLRPRHGKNKSGGGDEWEGSSMGSSETIESQLRMQEQQQQQQQRPSTPESQWPWKKHLSERNVPSSHDHPEENNSDDDEEQEFHHQCEFCGPTLAANAAYLRNYHSHLPSLAE